MSSSQNGSNIGIEKLLSSKEYIKFLSKADPKKKEISKNRICFLWENKYFELDVFSGFKSNLTLLEVEVERLDEKINLPPFIKIIREVTEEKQFTNVELSEDVK